MRKTTKKNIAKLSTVSLAAKSLKQKDSDLYQRVDNNFRIACKDIYPHQTLPGFTDHGLQHIINILKKTDELLSGVTSKNSLTAGEYFLLLNSLILHDIGQLSHDFVYNDPVETHQKHARKSEELIKKYADKFGFNEHEADYISKLCSSHGLHDYRANLKESWTIEGLGECRLHVLAALLRTADLLDLASSRTPSFVFNQRKLSYESKIHWERHAVITDVKIDPNDWSITVYAKPGEIKQLLQLELFKQWLQSELTNSSNDLRKIGLNYSQIKMEIDDSKYCKHVIATSKNNPYLGLRPFKSTHAALFFGRDKEINTILNLSRQYRFLSIVGESGVGKSSIINAGILHELSESGHMFQELRLSECVSSKINTSLLRNISDIIDLTQNASLSKIIDKLVKMGDEKQDFYLVVDQFEEIFTLSFNDAEKKEFVKTIHKILEKTLNFRVIVSIRSEFLIDLWELTDGNPVLFSGSNIHRLKKLSPERASEAVKRPMMKFKNLDWDSILVDKIIDELTDEGPGIYPPYLSLVCSNLIQAKFNLIQKLSKEERKGSFKIGFDLYDELGGVGNIINKEFQTILDAFSPTEREVIDRVLSKMITDFHSKKPINNDEVDLINKGRIDIKKAMDKLVNKRVVKKVHFGYELEHDLVARKLVLVLQKSVKASSKIREVIDYMQYSMSSRITIEDLAGVAKLSKAQFYRRFKNETGTTPIGYLQNISIQQACYLLRETEDPINLIGTNCGFGTMANFISVFKQQNNGLSPKAYRKSFREQNTSISGNEQVSSG